MVPMASPRLVRAVPASVAPVPPSAIASVPVIDDAPRFRASSVLSITKPPLALRSKLSSLPTRSRPSPAVKLAPLLEIVMEPEPLVIEIPVPAVSVALVSVLPEELPISS